MSNELTVINDTLASIEQNFQSVVAEHKAVKWESELNYAMQALSENSYLKKIAIGNKESLKNAIINTAAVGLSLNPANKHAYLVPRDGKVRLDISYMGLIHLACEAGALKWVQAEVVREKDSFEVTGVGEKPVHKFSPLLDRGEVTGAYCVAKTEDGEYLTTVMSYAEICSIRDRSTAFKKTGKGPWATDFEEMAKKTVIKRASKLWPKNDKRLSSAVLVANEDEGIDFEKEQAVEMITGGQVKLIKDLLEKINRKEEDFLPYLSSIEKKSIEDIKSITSESANRAIKILEDFAKGVK